MQAGRILIFEPATRSHGDRDWGAGLGWEAQHYKGQADGGLRPAAARCDRRVVLS
jgi:hypothetical protein